MFAEFEMGVHSFWRTIRPRARTAGQILLARVGERLNIPNDVIQGAQSVRVYLNTLLHENRDEELDVVSIADSRHRLAAYFARLPIHWGD